MLRREILISRLVKSKQIFLRGKEFASRLGGFNHLIAIILIDQAIESCLCTVIVALDKNVKNLSNLKFRELFTKADLATQNAIKRDMPEGSVFQPFEYGITTMHKIRNSAQHEGIIPSEEELKRCIIYCEDFLKRTFLRCFTINYDEVYLADVILYNDVRKYFKEAEDAFSKNDLEGTTVGLAKCYKFLQKHMSKNFPWESELEALIQADPYDADSNKTNKIVDLIKYVDNKVNILGSGSKLLDYKLFQEKAPVVNISYGGEITGCYLKTTEISKEDCIRMFDFVYNMILAHQTLE
jgi:hypothetical protein